MNQTVLRKLLSRPARSHKYDFGHVLVIGGSPGMVGAPLLAAQAALRSGAGLVTIAATPDVIDKLEGRVPEIMTSRLNGTEREILDGLQQLLRARKVNVILAGPGLQGDDIRLIRRLLSTAHVPVVLDGGALSLYKAHVPIPGGQAGRVLTPHLGEFARFFDEPLPATSRAVQALARTFAAEHGLTLVLKRHPTSVFNTTRRPYINKTGGPGLATAGSGDVLSGIIAAFVAQGIEPFAAAKAAVYLHGLAGDIATELKTQPGVIASDVIEAIPQALRDQ